MFDLDDVPVEMKDDPVVGHVLPGNEPDRRRGALGRRGVGEWPSAVNSTSVGWSKSNVAVKAAARPGAIVRLFHQTRRPHDLILVAGFALLNAGGQNLSGGHVGDRDSGASDLSPEDHRAMAYDAD